MEPTKIVDEPTEVLAARAEALGDAIEDFMLELRALREKRKLPQGVVAERMGVSQSAVSQFESYDSNPTLSTIRRYAMAIGARLDLRAEDEFELAVSAHRKIQPLSSDVEELRRLSWGRGHVANR